jgi:AraC-like DNA-binding protein
LNIDDSQRVTCDTRIVQMTKMVESFRLSDYSVESVSSLLSLSPSRLAHLFKEQTGMPLKSYLVMHRLMHAYSLLFQGKNITEAAMQSGFDSSSHLAMLNKKLTGVTASSILKNSEFLKAPFFNL